MPNALALEDVVGSESVWVNNKRGGSTSKLGVGISDAVKDSAKLMKINDNLVRDLPIYHGNGSLGEYKK